MLGEERRQRVFISMSLLHLAKTLPGMRHCKLDSLTFRNARLMHTFTSLIGAPLRVELQSAKIFEGILTVGRNVCQIQ